MQLAADYAQALAGARNDYDRLLESIGDARFVLLGEASHGTDEFYRERAAITRRLISSAVSAEPPETFPSGR
jgi:erythromycin esterase-like protein